MIRQEMVTNKPKQDIDRTRSGGKASAAQFVDSPLIGQQLRNWNSMEGPVTVLIGHPQHGYVAIIGDECRREIIRDLD